jgi:hypothetical protein
MLETASREIRQAAEAAERRRRETRRHPALMSALDELLSDLEELNLRGTTAAPEACRRRAAELMAEAAGAEALPEVPEAVADLMEVVYETQDAVLLERRRAVYGQDGIGAGRPGDSARRGWPDVPR